MMARSCCTEALTDAQIRFGEEPAENPVVIAFTGRVYVVKDGDLDLWISNTVFWLECPDDPLRVKHGLTDHR